jgi:SAM-dependent methyltransferase
MRLKWLKKMTAKNSAMQNKNYLEVTYGEANKNKSDYPEKLAKHLLDNYYLKPGRLLDIGCGNGDFLRAFTKLGFQVVGVDMSPDVKERLGDEFDVRLVDIEEGADHFQDEFDFVFSKSVIEHMREPTTLFKLSYTALKKNGIAVIMCPSWEHTYWGPFYIDHTHVTPFTRPSLEETFTLCDFKDSRVEYFYQLPFVWKNPLLKFIVKIIAKIPLPYSPWNRVPWQTNFWPNKLIRFSKEVMLLGSAKKK